MTIVPVIDLTFLQASGPDNAATQDVAGQIDAACREVGFFSIVGHGVDPALIKRLDVPAREFLRHDTKAGPLGTLHDVSTLSVSEQSLVFADPEHRAVVVGNPEGSRPPLVFFCSYTRDTENVLALAAALGPDQPVIGIEHPPADGPLPEDLTAWVAFHRAALEGLALDTPYHLAGFSFGGVIALEIAIQLQAEHQEVAWLGLVDTLRPKRNPQGVRRYLRYHLHELLDEPDRRRRRAHLLRMIGGGGRRTLLRARHQALRPLRAAGLVPASPRTTWADQRGLNPLKKAVWRGYLSHENRYYDGPVALFTGDENRAQAGGDPSLRWSKYLRGGIEVIPLPGAHREILRPPHVTVAAHEIAASVARARARADVPPTATREVAIPE